MKIAHIADVHLDRPFTGMSQAEGERSRRRLMEGFRRALRVAAERGVDLVTIGGDLWEHESVRVDTRRAVASALGDLSVPVVVICGNHDAWVAGGPHARTEWPSNVTMVSSNVPEEIRFDGPGGPVSVWAASWVGKDMDAGFLRDLRLEPGRRHLLLIHGTARAAGFFEEGETHCPFDPAAVARAGFDLCLAGHIHHGRVRDGVVYPGPPEPLGWGEDGTHSVAIVEVPGEGSLDVELVPTNTHSYSRIEVDCRDADSSAEIEARLRSALIDVDETVHVRAKLVGEIDPLCEIDVESLIESCGAPLAELRVVNRTEPRFDIEAIATRETVDGIFVRRIQELIEQEGDDPDRLARLKEGMHVGLRALEGRKEVIHVD